MKLRNPLLVLLIGSVLFSGCIFDDDDNDNGKEITNISELSMGGYLFVLPGQEIGLAQVATIEGERPFEDAEVYVNGMLLANNAGIHTNNHPLPLSALTTGPKIRFAVYAFGDSAISEVVIPETPVIEYPVDGTQYSIHDNLPVRIAYPGNHDYIAFSLNGQDLAPVGLESAQTVLSGEVESTYLTTAGTSQLNAYSANTSGKIPDDGFDLTDPQNIYVVASVAIRNVTFVDSK